MERAGHVIPYDKADEQRIRYRFLENEADRGHWFEIIPGVAAVWGRSGHLAGSVWFGLEMEGKRILYSGDYTSESMLLQDDDVADGFRWADLNRDSCVWVVPAPVQSLQDMSNSNAPNVKRMRTANRSAKWYLVKLWDRYWLINQHMLRPLLIQDLPDQRQH